MPKKTCIIFFFLISLSLSLISQVPDKASAQLTTDPPPHFKSGDEVSFKLKLNEALPEGMNLDARMSPVAFNQQVSTSNEPVDKDRRDFVVKFRVPEHARGGPWHIAVIWLIFPGSGTYSNTISTNDMQFIVDGPDSPLPTSATATIVKK